MLYIKALHIVFIVTWFAGLFYIVRLFIYITEALDKSEEEKRILLPQLQLMAKRLWFGITWPSAVLTFLFGSTLLYLNFIQYDAWPTWIIVKLGFLVLLYAYQIYCHSIYTTLASGKKGMSSTQLRIYNEVASVLLIAIVFLAIVKSTLSLAYGLAGLAIISLILLIAINVYKKKREQ